MLKLTLGAIQYYWSREAIFKFYESIARTPVDIVYLGETVCSRRHELRLADWLEIADRLADAGKQPVLSTLVLIESGMDVTTMRRIIDNGRYAVEANDIGAVHALNGSPFIAGPHLNIYNTPTLELFAALGATRWVMPLEMGRTGLAQILKCLPTVACRWRFPHAALPRVTAICPRTIANSVAWIILMVCCCRRVKTAIFLCSTVYRRNLPKSAIWSMNLRRCRPWV
jgi:hypothetical protein